MTRVFLFPPRVLSRKALEAIVTSTDNPILSDSFSGHLLCLILYFSMENHIHFYTFWIEAIQHSLDISIHTYTCVRNPEKKETICASSAHHSFVFSSLPS